MIAINVVMDEEQAAAVQALADVHTGGDLAEMIRLLVLERAQPTRFKIEMAKRAQEAAA